MVDYHVPKYSVCLSYKGKKLEKREFNRLLHGFKTNIKLFDRLYEYYFPRIVIHINRTFSDFHIGEDVAQEFFIKLFKINIPEQIDYPTSWVFRICDNIAKTHISSQKNKSPLPLEENCAATIQDVSDEFYALENGGISKENISALKELDKQTIEILVMKFWEGYDYKEIGAILGLSHDAVRQKASRGIKKLKTRMLNSHTLIMLLSLLG